MKTYLRMSIRLVKIIGVLIKRKAHTFLILSLVFTLFNLQAQNCSNPVFDEGIYDLSGDFDIYDPNNTANRGEAATAGAPVCDGGLIVVGFGADGGNANCTTHGIITKVANDGTVDWSRQAYDLDLVDDNLDQDDQDRFNTYVRFRDIKRIVNAPNSPLNICGNEELYIVVGSAQGGAAVFIIDALGCILDAEYVIDGQIKDANGEGVGVTQTFDAQGNSTGFVVACRVNQQSYIVKLGNDLERQWVSTTIADSWYPKSVVQCRIDNGVNEVIGYATVGEFIPGSGSAAGVVVALWEDPALFNCAAPNTNNPLFNTDCELIEVGHQVYLQNVQTTKAKYLAMSGDQTGATAQFAQQIGIAGIHTVGTAQFLMITLPNPVDLNVFNNNLSYATINTLPVPCGSGGYAQSLIGLPNNSWLLAGRGVIGGVTHMTTLEFSNNTTANDWSFYSGQDGNLDNTFGATAFNVTLTEDGNAALFGIANTRICGTGGCNGNGSLCVFNCGCQRDITDITSSADSYVVVHELGSNGNICADFTGPSVVTDSWDVTFTADCSGAASYTWDFGDGTIITGTNEMPTHTYQQNGFYLVCLEVLDPGSPTCTDEVCDWLNLHYCPDLSCDELICGGDFESFLPGLARLQLQSDVPAFGDLTTFNGYTNLSTDNIYNENTGNIFSQFARQLNYTEVFAYPLTVPLENGCGGTISFDVLYEYTGQSLLVYGFSGDICSSLDLAVTCDGQLINHCNNNLSQFCIEEIPVNSGIASGSYSINTFNFGDPGYMYDFNFGTLQRVNIPDDDFTTYTIDWFNNTGLPMDYIVMVPIRDPNFSTTGNSVYLDNLSIVSDCCVCECLVGYNIDGTANGGVTATSLSLPNVITDECISIEGHLIIDGIYEWSNCDVRMHPGASIEVANGATLTVSENTFIHGCEEMWQGIEVAGTGTYTMVESEIRDAEYAIYPTAGSTIELKGNTFLNNYIGLYYEESTAMGFTLTQFEGNTFGPTDINTAPPFLPPYPNQLNIPGVQSLAGIWLENFVTQSFNGSIGSLNVFQNMRNGMVLKDGDANVSGCRFLDLLEGEANGVGYPIEGFGIHMESTSSSNLFTLTQTANVGNLTSFESCNTGIYGRFSGVNVYSNFMTKVGRGIHIQFGHDVDHIVEGNLIQADHSGIEVRNSENTNSISIQKNIIAVDGISGYGDASNGIGIYINKGGISTSNPNSWVLVEGNIIDIFKSNEGIKIHNSERTAVLRNIINMNNSLDNLSGIAVFGTNVMGIVDNDIHGVGTVHTSWNPNIAMRIDQTTNLYISCNEMDSTRTGLKISGECRDLSGGKPVDAIIEYNVFGEHARGLLYTSTARTGPQINAWNRWEGAYSGNDLAALHSGSAYLENQYSFNENAVNLSGYYPNPIDVDPTPVPTNPTTSWFIFNDDTSLPGDCKKKGKEKAISKSGIVKPSNDDKIYCSVYPNPAKNEVSIELLDDAVGDVRIIIYNMIGQIIYEKSTQQTTSKLNTQNWKEGVYLIKVMSNGKALHHEKLLIVQ